MGSALGEVTFPAPVIKHEIPDNVEDIITQHSPQCELHVHITNIVSLHQHNESPASTENYSTDSTLIGGVITPQAHLIGNSSSSESSSQDITVPSLQDVTQKGHSHDLSTVNNAYPNVTVVPSLQSRDGSLSKSSIGDTDSLPAVKISTSLASQDVTALDQELINFTNRLQEATTVNNSGSQEQTTSVSSCKLNEPAKWNEPAKLQDVTLKSPMDSTSTSLNEGHHSEMNTDDSALHTQDSQDVMTGTEGTAQQLLPAQQTLLPIVNIIRNNDSTPTKPVMLVPIPSPSVVEVPTGHVSDSNTIEYAADTHSSDEAAPCPIQKISTLLLHHVHRMSRILSHLK